MKALLLIAALLAGTVYSGAAAPRCVIGISPFLQSAEKDQVFRKIVAYLLEDAPPGSSLWLYDAYLLRTITQIDIPGIRAFRSSKTRANQFKEEIARLRAFLAGDRPKPDAPNLDFDRALRLPQFLDFVSANLLGPDTAVTVVLLGSPLYMDAKEPSFSMAAGAFPSDGHLLAGRDQSVYGLKTRADALRGVTVHHCWFGDPWVSEVHRERILRFWSLYLAGQDARLASFCGDLPTVFNALKTPPGQLAARDPRHTLDTSSAKIEMLHVTREAASGDWIARDLLANAATTAPDATVGPMKIGIRWQGQLDLDLYASPGEGAGTLSFDHTRIPEGYYFKDHRASPEREYEFVEFESPVDLWKVQARINFFSGRSPAPPGGEVRVEFAGRIYTGRFALAARVGNEGRTGPDQGGYWFAIDLPEILKLREPAAAR